LINCHVHLSLFFPFHEADPHEHPAITVLRCQRRGMDALRAGITTIRTVGEKNGVDLHLRTMIQKGWVEGPRILSAGRGISVSGGHGTSEGTWEADGPEEFRKMARKEMAAGADHLKIFISGGIANLKEALDECQMTQAEMEAVVSVARSKNTYVTAHASGSANILKAVEAGIRCFEHGYLIDREAALAMRNHRCTLCPTLCVSRIRDWMVAQRFEFPLIEKAMGAAGEHLTSVATAISEGVRIVNGTDAPPGDQDRGVNLTVREMEFYVELGLSPLGALQASTVNGAELMDIADRVGVLDPGYEADIIAVRENPLEDIRAMRDIFFVMKAGRIIRWDQS
jgi:imidazolonepropionase-like amidohydrolase